MAKRTRSIIIDGEGNKIYTNVSDPTTANASNIIGNKTTKQVSYQSSANSTCVVAYNIGNSGQGVIFPTNSILTSIYMYVSQVPTARSISIDLKKGTSYSTSTVIGTYTISAGGSSSSNNINFTVLSSERLFIDITQVGLNQNGSGLNIIITYYAE